MKPDNTSNILCANKFGIVVDHFSSLAGATDFILSFIDGALLAAGAREVVLIWREPSQGSFLRRLARRVFRGPSEAVRRREKFLSNLRNYGISKLRVLSCDVGEASLLSVCQKNKVDVVGPLTPPPSQSFAIPSIGYIYDFQHKYLPHFFKPEDLKARDNHFQTVLSWSDVVVVNSEAVKKDVEKFFPEVAYRVVSLPFSAAAKSEWFKKDTGEVRKQYAIGKRYFMISNQFWVHKRHEIAIEAFAQVVRTLPDVELVLTGATWDSRDPGRLESVDDLIRCLDLRGKVHILGVIPKMDQVALMRGAIAVIQPTAFEGGPGGGSIFDAVALGVPTVVSDIPINREIANYVTHYFPLDDADALSKCLRDVIDCERPRSTVGSLLSSGEVRRIRLGRAIWQAADLAVEHRARMIRKCDN